VEPLGKGSGNRKTEGRKADQDAYLCGENCDSRLYLGEELIKMILKGREEGSGYKIEQERTWEKSNV